MNNVQISYGSVCSGIESASVAWEPLGWRPAWFAEIEPFPCSLLAHHYPEVPNLGDMTAIAARVRAGEIEAPDILVGGTPCQAFSVAGARAGLADPRGQLTLAYVDLANAIDSARLVLGKQPAVTVWENVPGVLSSADNAFGCFLGALAGESCELEPPGGKWKDAGCVFGPSRAIAWRILDAQYFGLAQRRRRVFVVSSAREGFDPTKILFEFEGLRRDSAPRRDSGEGSAAGTLRSTDGGSDVDHAKAGHIQPVLTCASNAEGATGLPFLTCSNIGKTVNNQTPLLALSVHGTQDPDICSEMAHTLGRNNGQENAVLAFAENSRAEVRLENGDGKIAGALSTGGGKPGQGTPCVCITGDITHTLKAEGFDASEDGTGRGQPIVPAYGIRTANTSSNGWGIQENVTHTLDCANGVAVSSGMAVRRLTPRECERLQGFPDNYTLIPVKRANDKASVEDSGSVTVTLIAGEFWKMSADGPRYKALGNSKAVPVVRWIGRRIQQAVFS